MSIAEMKEESIRRFVIRIAETNSETALKEILDFLDNTGQNSDNQLNLSQHYNGMKEQYGIVLEKLAK